MTGTIHLRVTRAEMPGQKRGAVQGGYGGGIRGSPLCWRHRGVEALGVMEVGAGFSPWKQRGSSGGGGTPSITPCWGQILSRDGRGPEHRSLPLLGTGLEKWPSESTESLFKSFPPHIVSRNELASGSEAIHWFHRSQKHPLTGLKRIPWEL